jgi:hypothetical protein
MPKYGSVGSDAKWEPSVKYLLILIVVEILVMGCLRTMTKHGG